MSFLAHEKGDSGRPIELYHFMCGSLSYTFTSAEQDIVYSLQTYQATPHKRSSIKDSRETVQSRLTIEVTRDHPIAQMFRGIPPADKVWLTIYRKHRDDDEVFAYWFGEVKRCSVTGLKATLECEPDIASLKRKALRYNFQNACNHVLYSLRCGVSDVTYMTNTTVAYAPVGSTIRSIDVGLKPDGYFRAGKVRRVSTGDVRFIIDHVGDTLTLTLPFEDLQVGEAIKVFAGCDHTFTTCVSKFNNGDNYGGCPLVPVKNPFEEAVH